MSLYWNLFLCIVLFIEDTRTECPPPEDIDTFRSDLCFLGKGKRCLCSSNRKHLLTIYTDRHGNDHLRCGGVMDKNDLATSRFNNFRLKLESADATKHYLLVMIDSNSNVFADKVRALWIKRRVPGSELSGIWRTDLTSPRDTLVYTPPTPARNTGIHRYQLYVFEHESGDNLSNMVDANDRDEFDMKQFMVRNFLCGMLVGGFQVNIEYAYDANNCIATATCNPGCGVDTLCLWSNVPCEDAPTIRRQALGRQPNVQLHSANRDDSYLLVALIKEDRTFRSAWIISDIKGDDLIAGTTDGSVIADYSAHSLQQDSMYQMFIILQESRVLPAQEQSRLRAFSAIEMANYVYFSQCSNIRGMFKSIIGRRSGGGDTEQDTEEDVGDYYDTPYDDSFYQENYSNCAPSVRYLYKMMLLILCNFVMVQRQLG